MKKYYNEITELIRQRNDTDPIDSLIKNSSAINIFYSPGIEIEEHIGRESRAMSCYKIRRALKLKKGQFDTLIEELVDNATYGGELRIYFNAGFNELVTNDNGNDFRTIRFHGDVIVAVANSFNGSGHHISLPLDITFPFVRDRLFVDSQVRYSMQPKYAECAGTSATPPAGKPDTKLSGIQAGTGRKKKHY